MVNHLDRCKSFKIILESVIVLIINILLPSNVETRECYLAQQMPSGIDFTASNEWQGRRSFKNHCLHALLLKEENPYQRAISVVGSALESFSASGFVHAFGFGDIRTKCSDVFNFDSEGFPCRGFSDVLASYKQIVKTIQLSGPTNYAPIIAKAQQIVKSSKKYTILVIITDGQLISPQHETPPNVINNANVDETVHQLISASKLPLSIVLVGVGDGPWDTMRDFDDRLYNRAFDNFQFVDFHAATTCTTTNRRQTTEAMFALHLLMEIPDQFRAIKQLGYIARDQGI